MSFDISLVVRSFTATSPTNITALNEGKADPSKRKSKASNDGKEVASPSLAKLRADAIRANSIKRFLGYEEGRYPLNQLNRWNFIPCTEARMKHWGVRVYLVTLMEEIETAQGDPRELATTKAALGLVPEANQMVKQICKNLCDFINRTRLFSPDPIRRHIYDVQANLSATIFPVENPAKFDLLQNDGFARQGYYTKYQSTEIPFEDADCGVYANYHMHNKKRIPALFPSQPQPQQAPTFDKYESFIEELLSMGYEPVKEPKPGDLVVYYQQPHPEAPLRPVHYGIFVGQGNVRSKWGVESVFTHKLCDVPLEFGDTFEFFRKKNKSEEVTKLLSKWQAAPGPLTEAGQIALFKEKFREMMHGEGARMMSKSLYGRKHLDRIADSVWRALDGLQNGSVQAGDAKSDSKHKDSDQKVGPQKPDTKQKGSDEKTSAKPEELTIEERIKATVRQACEDVLPDLSLL